MKMDYPPADQPLISQGSGQNGIMRVAGFGRYCGGLSPWLSCRIAAAAFRVGPFPVRLRNPDLTGPLSGVLHGSWLIRSSRHAQRIATDAAHFHRMPDENTHD